MATNILLYPLLRNYSQRLLTTGINVYEDLTGESIETNKIHKTLGFGIDIIHALSSPIGAIQVTYNYASAIINEQIEIKKSNNKAAFIKKGIGKIVSSYGRYN